MATRAPFAALGRAPDGDATDDRGIDPRLPLHFRLRLGSGARLAFSPGRSCIRSRRNAVPRLTGFRVAVIATDGFEETELTEPVKALRGAGASVCILAPRLGYIQGVRHDLDKTVRLKADRALAEADAKEFDAVHLPGGTVNADSLRTLPEVQRFLRDMQKAGKPIVAICHAAWELVSAGLVRGRTLTSYHSIQDDIRNAGGEWVDREVVQDENWLTSRQPSDLRAFNRAMLTLFLQNATARRSA
jgi:protease I